jgi:hypothetical protein
MKKLFAILLLLAFAVQFIPAVKSLVFAGSTCIVDLEDDKTPEKKEDKKGETKELKDFMGHVSVSTVNAAARCSHPYSSHFPGDNPAFDILTPPPNRA